MRAAVKRKIAARSLTYAKPRAWAAPKPARRHAHAAEP